jgi:hypothetical protein
VQRAKGNWQSATLPLSHGAVGSYCTHTRNKHRACERPRLVATTLLFVVTATRSQPWRAVAQGAQVTAAEREATLLWIQDAIYSSMVATMHPHLVGRCLNLAAAMNDKACDAMLIPSTTTTTRVCCHLAPYSSQRWVVVCPCQRRLQIGPVCQSELRASGSEIRGVAGQYAMGLLKV